MLLLKLVIKGNIIKKLCPNGHSFFIISGIIYLEKFHSFQVGFISQIVIYIAEIY